MIESTRKGYPVTNELINVGGIKYPVTHKFIVGEIEEEMGSIDTVDGLILEEKRKESEAKRKDLA